MTQSTRGRQRNKRVAAKIAEHLGKAPDTTVLLLKGHLIVEEHINYALAGIFVQAEALNEARLTFFQKLQVLRALDRFGTAEHWIDAAVKLNRLRNKLAHELEPVGIEDGLATFIKEIGDWPGAKIKKNEDIRLKFIRCIIHIGSALDTYRTMYKILGDFAAGYALAKDGRGEELAEIRRLISETC